ncbi:MAG: Lrp/AsnC family transcriptional regulator [Chloroflexota bacterium]
MALSIELDSTDWAILRELQDDARMSFAEIGRRVSLSSPAVKERISKLEDAGVIAGYRVDINLEAIGYPVQAFVRLQNSSSHYEDTVLSIARDVPEVIECHHISGDDCYMIRIAAQSIGHLEEVASKFREFTSTTTTFIVSSPIEQRVIAPKETNTK